MREEERRRLLEPADPADFLRVRQLGEHRDFGAPLLQPDIDPSELERLRLLTRHRVHPRVRIPERDVRIVHPRKRPTFERGVGSCRLIVAITLLPLLSPAPASA